MKLGPKHDSDNKSQGKKSYFLYIAENEYSLSTDFYGYKKKSGGE